MTSAPLQGDRGMNRIATLRRQITSLPIGSLRRQALEALLESSS